MSYCKEKFKTPDKKFVPYSFTFANGDFTKENMCAIAKGMQEKGLSPGYIQDRGLGDDERFTTPKFFENIKEIIECTDLPLGLCDEQGGIYGCSVFQHTDKYYPKGISLYWEKHTDIVPDCFVAVSLKMDSDKVITNSIRKVNTGDRVNNDEIIYAFHKYHDVSLSGSEIDYLADEMSDIIIENVYEKIKEGLGEYFGNRFTGLFMDLEGDFGYKLAYNDELYGIYNKLFNEDMFEILPLLFLEDTDGLWMRARYRYHTAITHTYKRFFEKLANWCVENNIEFTGHTWEENLYGQVIQQGDFYEIEKMFTIIGVDSLRLDCYSPRDFKEAQTIADKENKGYMCEAMACVGWGVSPEEIKRAINCMTLYGVTQIVPHGIHTDRKNFDAMGFAPDSYDINPYWNYFEQISAYATRNSYMNSLGKMSVDTVLINPINSVKALVGDYVFDKDCEFTAYIIEQKDILKLKHGWEINKIEADYSEVINTLHNNRVQFHIYDDIYFMESDFDGIENIVVPTMAIISLEMSKKLVELSNNGKKIYVTGELPYASTENGKNDKEIFNLLSQLNIYKYDINEINSEVKIISDNFDLRTSHRTDDKYDYFYLYNDSDKLHSAVIEFTDIFGEAFLLNPETGEQVSANTLKTNKGTQIYVNFDAYEAYWVLIKKEKTIKLTDFVCDKSDRMLFDPDFTGFTTFTTKFTLEEFEKVSLEIDRVYHTGEVFVNGHSVGARMWKPFIYDLTRYAKTGENTLEIKVGNLMCNSLKDYGDKWQITIHRPNPKESYYTGIYGDVKLIIS